MASHGAVLRTNGGGIEENEKTTVARGSGGIVVVVGVSGCTAGIVHVDVDGFELDAMRV
jgi:hypothetical protein